MTEPDQGEFDDLAHDPATSPPLTGHAAIDEALGELADLGSTSLADHHDRLAKAHETLHEALDRPDNQRDDGEPR
ncbi:MAG TPA: hypothetical protein VFP81_01970 [Propionibacteriaceae bacterium]|nr:hypothetical protein [Propionibacteriaceae bacterium]